MQANNKMPCSRSNEVNQVRSVNPYAALLQRTPRSCPSSSTTQISEKKEKKRSTVIEENPIRSALKRSQRKVKETDIIAKPIYSNTLPDLSYGPKSFTPYHTYNINRFAEYKTSSLEQRFQYDLPVGTDMDLHVNLVIPPTCNAWFGSSTSGAAESEATDAAAGMMDDDENEKLLAMDPKDIKLIDEDDWLPPTSSAISKLTVPRKSLRSSYHKKNVPCFKRTEYISAEQFNRPSYCQDRSEAKLGYIMQKENREMLFNNYNDRQSQIIAIEKTFDDSTKPITKHFSKPNIVPVEILPVFPDFVNFKYTFAQISFDSDPTPLEKTVTDEYFARAQLRGVTDESDEQFVAYFLPSDETVKRFEKEKKAADENEDKMDEIEQEPYEFELSREYNFVVKGKDFKGVLESAFFVVRDNGVFYNELGTRVALTKRKGSGLRSSRKFKSKLFVHDVPLTKQDIETQQLRGKYLESNENKLNREGIRNDNDGKVDEGGFGNDKDDTCNDNDGKVDEGGFGNDEDDTRNDNDGTVDEGGFGNDEDDSQPEVEAETEQAEQEEQELQDLDIPDE